VIALLETPTNYDAMELKKAVKVTIHQGPINTSDLQDRLTNLIYIVSDEIYEYFISGIHKDITFNLVLA
jgi:hypothetical protein